MDRTETITLKTSSLYRLAYTVPLCSLFLYFSKLILFGPCIINLPGVYVSDSLQVAFSDANGKVFLQGQSKFKLHDDEGIDYCGRHPHNDQFGCLEQPHNQRIYISLNDSGDTDVSCWQVRREGLRCANQVIKDCYKLADQHWYGGFESLTQLWPLKQASIHPDGVLLDREDILPPEGVQLNFGPYVSGDFGIHGVELENILEGLFISSSGVGIMVSETTPLYLSFNQHEDEQICLGATYDNVHYASLLSEPPVLEYTVCKAKDVKKIQSYMRKRFISTPMALPNIELFKSPIWSTWAQFNKDVNQTAVMELADKIEAYKLPCSQIEIDDKWTQTYGDFDFDTVKFPEPKKMVSDLKKRGFPITLWTHPFFNVESQLFTEARQHKYIVMSRVSDIPGLVNWWNGDMAAVLDVTNPAAVLWYQMKLGRLQKKYNISSFKFDGGEALFVPHSHLAHSHMTSTNKYSTEWAELAFNADPRSRRQEVRVGWRTQHLPIFTRLIDRMSTWDAKAGLQSVIPSVLTLSVIGYPFVLPDMIGGNAYSDMLTFKGGAYPDRELYIRWMQLNCLLPAMQISVAPWHYDEEVVLITRKFLKLREQYITKILELAQESVETGDPIIRPLWWVAPLDEQALVVGDEFLVGNDLLVAPVVEEGARERDIYVPPGQWKDTLRDNVIDGPASLKEYAVALDELAVFERIIDQPL